jgi:intracellular sulfur oxidation DsrE/DsrF family protein
MKRKDLISDEQLNAFADGELEADEENHILSKAEECPELDARLCQQRKLKELVQHGYRNVPAPRSRDAEHSPRRRLFGLAVAALLLLAVGLGGGWTVSRMLSPDVGPGTAAVPAESDRWLLHVVSSDPADMKRALARAEQLMVSSADAQERGVEIVANEGGLDLLRSDVSPFAVRIRELADQDVLFYACSRAIQRLEERGVEVRLLPEADTRYTALDRVVLRLQDGWNYEKI